MKKKVLPVAANFSLNKKAKNKKIGNIFNYFYIFSQLHIVFQETIQLGVLLEDLH